MTFIDCQKGNDMTNNIDIDLDAIPHPKDCYRVLTGATIPAGTPLWTPIGEGRLLWSSNGYSVDWEIHEFSTPRFTAEPIIPRPAPEDSPIIINHHKLNNGATITDVLAVWAGDDTEWVLVDDNGRDWWIDASEITDWSPAIVTKTGNGVWDERDKRDRIDADGGIWVWVRPRSAWVCDIGGMAVFFGSLNAFAEYYGANYLLGFADDGDAPCE